MLIHTKLAKTPLRSLSSPDKETCADPTLFVLIETLASFWRVKVGRNSVFSLFSLSL